MWGINAANQIFQFNPVNQDWVLIPGQLGQIAVGFDGAVWGLNASGQIYRYDPSNPAGPWDLISGTLGQLAVGGDAVVWGINTTIGFAGSGYVYQFRWP